MKKTGLVLALVFLLAVILGCSVSTGYLFSVLRADVTVDINPDGTMDITYKYTFKNSESGQIIDHIDIETPNNEFLLEDVSVTVNEKTSSEVKVTWADEKKTGLQNGITLEMGSQSIAQNQSAAVKVVIPNLKNSINPATPETVETRIFITLAPDADLSESLPGETPKSETPTPLVFETGTSETAEYVDFHFSPNRFDKRYVKGTTIYTFRIILPPPGFC